MGVVSSMWKVDEEYFYIGVPVTQIYRPKALSLDGGHILMSGHNIANIPSNSEVWR